MVEDLRCWSSSGEVGEEGRGGGGRRGRGDVALHLHHLTFDEVRENTRDQLDDFDAAETGEGEGGAGEEEVAGEDGKFVAEEVGSGGGTSTSFGDVDYVVVKEGGDVNELDDLGETALGGEEDGGVGVGGGWCEGGKGGERVFDEIGGVLDE